MRHKFFHVLYALVGLGFLLLFIWGKKNDELAQVKNSINPKIHDLPALHLKEVKSNTDTIAAFTIINLFTPDCDHCQYMAKQIFKHKDQFKTFNVSVVPAFFIYNKKNQLINSIYGETKIENLIEAIK